MRRAPALLLSLATALPAAAQVRAVPSQPVPLVYRGQIERGDAGAALRFLGDANAMTWFAQKRPADLAPMLQAAHQLADLRETALYAAQPVALRRALVARADAELYAHPSRLMSAVRADPALAPKEGEYARAAMEWSALSAAERHALVKHGADEAGWASVPLLKRQEALRAVYQARWRAKTEDVPPGSPRYLALLDAFLETVGGVLKPSEEAEMREFRDKLAVHQERLAAARAKIEALGDPGLASALARIETNGDLNAAARELDALFEDSSPRPARATAPAGASAAAPAVPAGPAEAEVFAAVAARLPALSRRLLAGTKPGAMLEELAKDPLGMKVEIGKSIPGSGAHFDPAKDHVMLNASDLRAFLAWQKRPAADLLTDERLLARFAALMLPVYAHEETHRRQLRAAQARGLTLSDKYAFYSQADEDEAFMSQALAARALLAREPFRRFVSEAWKNAGTRHLADFWSPAERTPAELRRHVRAHYASTPGEHAVRARAVAYARMEAARLKPAAKEISAELARRRRLPAVERDALGRLPAPSGPAAIGLYPTRVLRDFLRRGDERTHEALKPRYGYLQGLARVRGELAEALSPAPSGK